MQIIISGQVQGVGFRPYAYRLANKHGLTGFVQNNSAGVLIEIQGLNAAAFLIALPKKLPPLAHISDIQFKQIDSIKNEKNFEIIASSEGIARSMICEDSSICDDCLNELFDTNSRFFHYPFLNCTQCGPRLSIIKSLPYDRQQTSMDCFPLCIECEKDYKDPDNRRYHAEPTACNHCGPKLSLEISEIANALLEGKIIALKGLGGYQLLCNAKNQKAVKNLRARKNRPAKPFALMLANTQIAHTIAHINPDEQRLLESRARPIVLLEKKDISLPESVAPGLSHLGIMLPSTALHHLLFNAISNITNGMEESLLIVTSANLSDAPLLIDDKLALKKLANIADIIVTYNRKIMTRLDDSVMRVINNKPIFIRRARGYAPQCIKLPYPIPSTLALGGALKNTFCITRHDEAFISQHIGNLSNQNTIEFFHESLTQWSSLLNVKIERIACDKHPDFYTSQLAYSFNLPVSPVQHHHAHLASVAAEYAIITPALGLALDGYGYGENKEAWGGELLLLDKSNFTRLGSFLPLPQPGGDLSAKEPWRMAASVLNCLNLNAEITQRFQDKPQATLLANLLKANMSVSLTSSCGRLFDAASALLNINSISEYEGQTAMLLESRFSEMEILPNGWIIDNTTLNFLPLMRYLLNVNPTRGANLFHGTLVAGLSEWVLLWANKLSCQDILLSGGCFLNKVLSEGLYKTLSPKGLNIYLPKQLPPNDGGLSLGQAWVAGNQIKRVSTVTTDTYPS